jgi:hypothetical protein
VILGNGSWKPLLSQKEVKEKKKKSKKEDELNLRLIMQICYVFCSSEKGYAHLGKQIHIPGIQLCACFACTLLTRKFKNTIFSRAKEELQVVVGPPQGLCCLLDIQ